MKKWRWTVMNQSSRGAVAAAVLAVAPVWAADWTGTNSGNWNDPANWGGTLPSSGSALVFNNNNQVNTNNNRVDVSTYAGITFGSSAGSFTLAGNAIDVGGDILDSSAQSQTIALSMNLGNVTRILNIVDVASTVIISGNLTGLGGLSKTGLGGITLSGTNTIQGGMTLSGMIHVNSPGALGTGPVTINGGTNLDNTSGAPITINTSGGMTWTSSFQFDGTNDLNLGTGTLTFLGNNALTVAAGTLTVGGPMTGLGAFRKGGSGTMVMAGVNTYSGNTTLDGGTLRYIVNNPGLKLLNIGTLAGQNIGTLDLSSASITATNMAAQTNSTATNFITLGAGQALTLTGNVTIGSDNSTTNLTMTGNGNFTGTGNATSAGNIYSGPGQTGTLIFGGGTNTLTYATITIGSNFNGNGAFANVFLGTGNNIFNADTILLGQGKGGGTVTFASTASGNLTIRDKAGTGRATITIANQSAGMTNDSPVGNLTLDGHTVNILGSKLTLGRRSATSGGETGILSFDAGIVDLTQIAMAERVNQGTVSAMLSVGGTGQLIVGVGVPASASFSLANGAGGTGTLDLKGGSATINANITQTNAAGAIILVEGGTLDMRAHNIGSAANPITLTATSGTIRNLGAINGTAGLVKTGIGTLTLEGTANSYSGGTSVNAGTLVVAGSLPIGGNVTVSGNLTVAPGTIASKIESLTLAGAPASAGGWLGKVDLNDAALALQTTGGADKITKLAMLTDQVVAGRHGGDWAGNGVTSTTAKNLPSGFGAYAVGLFDNVTLNLATLGVGGPGVDADTLIIAATFSGDANFDKKVDISDLTAIANHWQTAQSNWTTGDLTGDGVVDINDLTAVANNWQAGVPPFTTSISSPVNPSPEPGSLTLLAIPVLLARRRSK